MAAIQVAVGVLLHQTQVLIARRQAHQHQGNRWEFPGGKVDSGETVTTALVRELQEELNLQLEPTDFTPLLQVPFDYGDKSVLLDVYWTTVPALLYSTVQGNEGQEVRWVERTDLGLYEFPAANVVIVEALQQLDLA